MIHENRDFYADVKSNRVPDHDVLVTNPPYIHTQDTNFEYALTRTPNDPSLCCFRVTSCQSSGTKMQYENISLHLKSKRFLWCPRPNTSTSISTGKGHGYPSRITRSYVREATEKLYNCSKALVEKPKQAAVYRTPMELEKGGVIKLNRKRGNRYSRKRAKTRSKRTYLITHDATQSPATLTFNESKNSCSPPSIRTRPPVHARNTFVRRPVPSLPSTRTAVYRNRYHVNL